MCHERWGAARFRVRHCFTDEGGPLGTGLQELVSNHLCRLWSKATVVSAEEKGLAMTGSGDWQDEDRNVLQLFKPVLRLRNLF